MSDTGLRFSWSALQPKMWRCCKIRLIYRIVIRSTMSFFGNLATAGPIRIFSGQMQIKPFQIASTIMSSRKNLWRAMRPTLRASGPCCSALEFLSGNYLNKNLHLQGEWGTPYDNVKKAQRFTLSRAEVLHIFMKLLVLENLNFSNATWAISLEKNWWTRKVYSVLIFVIFCH